MMHSNFRGLKVCGLALAISALSSNSALAQAPDSGLEEVVVTGIRASLQNALDEKKSANSLVEVIKAEDIGKLPDQNLAEVLENVTGIQITRTAGVGTGVQIRGTNANRTEINGISTVGAGTGRNGLGFEDINASMIAAVTVTKNPEAKTVEGSVGGTINLETIRPLELKETLGNVRIQGEQSSLSTQGTKPRFSAAFGDNWSTGIGDIGFVISGSYTEQEAVSFRPRTDRDTLVSAGTSTLDTPVTEDFLGIQFLVQEQENDDYETMNLSTTLEWAPNDELKFHLDAILTDQERSRDQYRLEASGVSNLRNFSTPATFESVDFGSIGDTEIGEINAALTGTLFPEIDPANVNADGLILDGVNPDAGNFRAGSETGSRLTESKIFAFGGEWQGDNLTASFEIARSTATTRNPTLNTKLNFLNPNAPLLNQVTLNSDSLTDDILDTYLNLQDSDFLTSTRTVLVDEGDRADIMAEMVDTSSVGSASLFEVEAASADIVTAEMERRIIENGQTVADFLADTGTASLDDFIGESRILNENATPYVYDLSGNSLSFGIPEYDPVTNANAPTAAQLRDASNYVLDQLDYGNNKTENSDTAVRFDFSYALADEGLTSVDVGIRHNIAKSKFEDIDDRIGGFSRLRDAASAALFADVLVAGPDNYGDADGRSLFISDFLLPDPDISFEDPDRVIGLVQVASANHDESPDFLSPSSDENSFFDVEETTTALYAQANFEFGILRGNAGFRWIDTTVDSTAFGEAADGSGDRELQTTSGGYDFILPRLNLTVQPSEELLVRFGYGTDIRRPNFDQLNTAFTLDPSENAVVALGNPSLEPEEVKSIDLSVEYYFSPASVVSVGIFKKDRTNIFGNRLEDAPLINGLRETDPSCPAGGTYNPIVQPNVLGDPGTLGLCVAFTEPSNDPATTTQEGIEFTFQYDLAGYEDSLGWASGFGVLFNYTHQQFSGGSVEDSATNRGQDVFEAITGEVDGEFSQERGLVDFSENAYNFTLFYERSGLSARMRYTWREAFRTFDFGGGANTSGSSTFGFPVYTADRGQLNASINYDVTDNLNVGLEAVNLTEEGIKQTCVSESGPVCFVGLPDRRVTFGASYRF